MVNFLRNHKKTIWWLVLLICSSIYIYLHKGRIANTPSDIDKYIIIIFIALMLMPLIQELSFAGFSMKKQIDSAKEEFKSEMQKIKLEIMQFSLNNSIKSDIKSDIGNDLLPSKETIENDLKTKNEQKNNEITDKCRLEIDVSDEVVTLFKSRYAIEERVDYVATKYGMDSNRNLGQKIRFVFLERLINRRTYEYLKKVVAICNRGIHGEIIDKSYIDYVNEITPIILERLTATRFKEMEETLEYRP